MKVWIFDGQTERFNDISVISDGRGKTNYGY